VPQILPKSRLLERGQPIEERLYDDALRREQKFVENRVQLKNGKPLTGKAKRPRIKLTQESQKLLGLRFIREFEEGFHFLTQSLHY
jgi:hypothetical protein